RVMGTAAIVERLPQSGDVARVFALQQRHELLVDQAGQRLVLRHPADLRLGLAPAGQAAFGVDPHQGPVERQGAAEIADVLPLWGGWDLDPERPDRFYFHDPDPPTRAPRPSSFRCHRPTPIPPFSNTADPPGFLGSPALAIATR